METLIEKSLSGDENAYAELIKLIEPDLYKVAKVRLKNEDDIEDAFQETIIKSYQHLDKLKNKQFFKTWITRILINECNNINKSYNKSNDLFDKVIHKSDPYTFTANTDNIDDSIFMDELLDKLSDNEKELAYLYFKENFTTEKIAELLNSNKNTVKSRLYRISKKLKQLAILLLILCIITTTTVFAKDIIKFIISLFTTSRQAIDTAVENDYVQNVDMEFSYDKDIGIKVDYILIDNKNLNVSYVFDCKSDSDITAVELVDYSIVDENGNKIFSNGAEDITKISEHYGKQLITDENFFRYSHLYTAKRYFPISNKLIFNITSVSLHYINEEKIIGGIWNFKIKLEDKFLKRDSEMYSASYCEYIDNISTDLDETSLTIKIDLNIKIDEIAVESIFFDLSNVYLENTLNQKYTLLTCKTYNRIENNNLGYVELKYDISKYYENIDNLHLYVKFDTNKFIDITLRKEPSRDG